MVRKKTILTLVWAIILSYICSMAYARNEGLAGLVDSKDAIKVYLKGFTNDSGQGHISPEEFRKVLESSILNRKSVKFEIVNTPEASDVQISGVIKKYQYLERGPVKINPGAGTMLLEMAATATHNYAEMETEFIITDTKAGQVLWQDTINTYIKKVMTPAESIPLVFDKLSRTFLWKSFGKKK